MKLNLDIDIKKIITVIFSHKAKKVLTAFLKKWIQRFVLLIALLLFFYCIYIWYSFIYNSEWSEQQKSDYINTHNDKTTFDVKDFERVVGETTRRKNESQNIIENVNDVFGLK